MARSIDTIYNIIIAAKDAETNLSGLNSMSTTALYKLYAYIVAIATHTLEILWDAYKLDVDNKIMNGAYGSVRWWYNVCKMFQLGDQLSWINNNHFGYTIIDLNKQIISRVAVTEKNGKVNIKVAKLVGSIVAELSVQELISFKAYIAKIKPAGIPVLVSSLSADKLKITFQVVYDPMILTSSGLLIIDNSDVIRQAVNEYLSGIVYGGSLNRTKLIDAVQLVQGVIDVTIFSIQVQVGTSSNWLMVTTQNYEAVSGYFKLDTLTLNTISNV